MCHESFYTEEYMEYLNDRGSHSESKRAYVSAVPPSTMALGKLFNLINLNFLLWKME